MQPMILHPSSCHTYLHLTLDYTACWWNLKCPTHCGNVVTPHRWYRRLLVTNKNNTHCYTWRLHLVSFTKLHMKSCNALLNNIMYIIYILISGVAAVVPHMHDVDWCPALHKPTVIVIQLSTQGHRMCGMHISKLLQNTKWRYEYNCLMYLLTCIRNIGTQFR